MLKIRLSRTGRKRQPYYRVVVAEHKRPVKSNFVEVIGQYNPRTKELQIEKDRVEHWISVGAKPTNTVARLFKKNGFADMDKYIAFVTFKVKPKEEEEAPAAEGSTEEASQAEEAPKEEAAVEENKE